MTRIAVTGASGFIGSHLVDRLLADGHTVVALLRPESRSTELEGRGAQVVQATSPIPPPSSGRSPIATSSFIRRAPRRTAAFRLVPWNR
jgi:nucleoside-diphosphate-sugar epimerase